MTATVLGIDTGSWAVLIAAFALLVTLYGTWIARAAAQAAKRAADAAEASALHSEQLAGAVERSAEAEERGVAIEEERVRHEVRQRIERDAPRWGPIGENEEAWWISDENQLVGVLVNSGKTIAAVIDVCLDLPAGGGLVGRFRAEPPSPADGGFVSRLDVRPGAAMRLQFDTTDGSLGAGLPGHIRPRVRIIARSEELDWNGIQTIELLRRPGDVRWALRWQPRPVD